MQETTANLLGAAIMMVPVLVVAGRTGVFGGGVRQRRRAEGFAARVGVPGDRVDAAFARRVIRRQRFVVAGVLLGITASWLVAGGLALIYAGLALGAVADQLATPRPAPGTPRFARPVSLRLTDYVPAWLLGTATAAAALVPLLALLRAVAPETPRGLDTELSAVGHAGLVAVAAAGLAASLMLARFLVRRPHAVSSAADLEVDDAFRAQAVRDALHLTAAISLLAASRVAYTLSEQDVDGVLRRVGGLSWLVLLLAVVVVGVLHELTDVPRHWRSRLAVAR